MFSGSIVALITPFNQGQVDEKALTHLLEWHIDQGTQGILVLGSTGEGALLTPQERHQVLSLTVTCVNKRIPVIAGCGSVSTSETVGLVRQAETLGVDAALVVTPYYVKPMAEGIFQHFQALSQASSLPLIIYNNPGRAVIDLSVPLLARLATLPTVVGIKDSSIDVIRLLRLRQAISKPLCYLSGDDPTTPAFMAHGGDGCISVTANVAPRLCFELIEAWQKKDMNRFAIIRDRLFPLHEALLSETNPSPLKFAVSLLGKCHNELRLPLIPVAPKTETMIRETMGTLGLLT